MLQLLQVTTYALLVGHISNQCHAALFTLHTFCRSTGTKGCAFALTETLAAVTAVQQVVEGIHADTGLTSLQSSQQPLQDALQTLWEQSISLAGRKAVNSALIVVPGAVQKLMALLQVLKHVTWHVCTSRSVSVQLRVYCEPD